MRESLKEMDELKRDLSDDEERCAQTSASAQVLQQQLAVVEQRADANIRQTQQDLRTVRETLQALAGAAQAVQTTSGGGSTSALAGSSSCQPPQTPPGPRDDDPGIEPSLMTPAGLPMQGVIVQGMLSPPGLIASVVGAPIILPSAGTLAAAGRTGGGSGVAAMPPPPARPPSNRSIAAPQPSSSSNEALPPRKANLDPSVDDESAHGASSSEEATATSSVEGTRTKAQRRGATD